MGQPSLRAVFPLRVVRGFPPVFQGFTDAARTQNVTLFTTGTVADCSKTPFDAERPVSAAKTRCENGFLRGREVAEQLGITAKAVGGTITLSPAAGVE